MAYIADYISVKGENHDSNEDSCVCGRGCLLVADGMGGEAAGGVASRIVADTLWECLEPYDGRWDSCSDLEIEQILLGAIARSDEAVCLYVDEHPESDGMGSTAVVAVVAGGRIHVAWCGDSRCYVHRAGGELELLTRDHSFVQQLVDKGYITAGQAMHHPDSNLLVRFVGGGSDYAEADFATAPFGEGDIVMLCSDGLSGFSTDDSIRRAFEENGDSPASVCRALVRRALEDKSTDDITVAVMSEASAKRQKSLFSIFRR